MLQIQSPFQQLFDTNGSPLDDGYVYIGTANANPETSPIAIYWDDAGTIPAAQPLRTLNGYIVRSGTPARVYTALEDFSMTVKDKQGRVVFSVLDATSLSNLQNNLASSSGSSLVGFLQAGANAQARTVQSKLRDVIDIRDFDITPDGVTDRTAAINAVTAALGAASYRGTLVIPAGTKFNTDTVFAAVPTGVMLDITDSVNWGQPPGYRNRFRMLYSSDLVNDDTQQIIASNHHPAMMLLNTGTAASVAASSRYGTILHGVGKDVDGDPMLGWFQQFAKHPSLNKWRISWRLNTPYNVAIANPTYWASAQVVPAGAYRISDGGKVYQTTAGGTCGGTAPTGTGSGINDGGVLWNYVQAAIGIDSTRMDLDEDANSGFYGPSSVRMTFNGNGREHYFEVDPVSQDVVWRDNSRSTDLWRSSTANGLRTGRIQSLNRVNTTVSATGAITLLAPLHTLTASGGPWDITDLTLPAGQTSGMVTLWFLTANLTLKNNANIVTRTGADIVSAPSMMVTLYKDTAISGSWIVMSKN
ncbi:MAG: hypothetical protein ING25_10650 [Burkholderiales bacterium]|nr:hypothetical protein [Burkholderiales bacterium]